jgi:hypothetical protein
MSVKKNEEKFIRVCIESKQAEFKAIGERVQRGEIKLAYYAIDNGKGYHYYLVIK